MSFKDTFTRGDQSESKLQYDDTAFSYFMIAIAAAICVPLLISILKPIFFHPSKRLVNYQHPTETQRRKAEQIYKQKRFEFLKFSYFLKVRRASECGTPSAKRLARD